MESKTIALCRVSAEFSRQIEMCFERLDTLFNAIQDESLSEAIRARLNEEYVEMYKCIDTLREKMYETDKSILENLEKQYA